MSLVRCKCGVYTSYGLFCVSCMKDYNISTIEHHNPDEVDENELDEYGFTVIPDIKTYDSDFEEED